MSFDLSLGELQALVSKAARGAGRSFGMAEEAGRAARWLTERGGNGAGAVARLLELTDGADMARLSPELPGMTCRGRAMCPLILGAYLSDTGRLPEGPVGPVLEPLILAPFLADLTGVDGVRADWGEGAFGITGDGDLTGETGSAAARVLTLSAGALPGTAHGRRRRARVVPPAYTILMTLAARTYAPATEESRARGAGAGLIDSD